MKHYQQVDLIVTPAAISAKSKPAGPVKKLLENAGIGVAEIREQKIKRPPSKKFQSKTFADRPPVYIKTTMDGASTNPWDIAHQAITALGAQAAYIEPDLFNEYAADQDIDAAYKKTKNNKTSTKKAAGSFDPDWKPDKNMIWHLDDAFSQLKSARDAVANLDHNIRIAHLDTGYNATHIIVPQSAKKNPLQRSFLKGEDMADAHDRYTSGTLRMPGHGTGTLGILAGNKININNEDGSFHDYLGGAPFAEIVTCRIAASVVLLKTSAFADALDYLTGLTLNGTPIHVVSMSMGGAPSKAWADAVNRAYEAGITLVTAAGNHFNGLPTRHLVYPARFQRVIAACGVTYDLKPYLHKKLGEMQGCCGPEQYMDSAIAAFTPNTPWATGNARGISFAGAGTSSATPQVAAAAAIYYRHNFKMLETLKPWQRVEAIRHALFASASKKASAPGTIKASFGNGILKANDALKLPVNTNLPQTPPDKVPFFPILATIFKGKPNASITKKLDMYNTELAQLLYEDPMLQTILENETKPFEKINKKRWDQFKDAVIGHPEASVALRQYLMAT